MKVWFRCYKCGKAFEAEERVRTDVCPHCMSFVDLARAEKITAADDKNTPDEGSFFAAHSARATPSSPKSAAKAAMLSAKESANGAPPAGEAGTPLQVSPQGSPAGAEAEDTYDSLYAKAEKMLTFGAWGNAAELFRRCLALRDCWQVRFGLVRAATRELTDLSKFADVQKDADAAFDQMTAAERLSLGKRYVPELEKKRKSIRKSYAALDLQGDKPLTKSTQKNSKKWIAAIILGFVIMLVLVMIGVIIYVDQPDDGIVIIIMGVVLGILGIVFASIAAARQKRTAAKLAAAADIAGNSRNVERAKLKAQIDAIDYLCGFLKY